MGCIWNIFVNFCRTGSCRKGSRALGLSGFWSACGRDRGLEYNDGASGRREPDCGWILWGSSWSRASGSRENLSARDWNRRWPVLLYQWNLSGFLEKFIAAMVREYVLRFVLSGILCVGKGFQTQRYAEADHTISSVCRSARILDDSRDFFQKIKEERVFHGGIRMKLRASFTVEAAGVMAAVMFVIMVLISQAFRLKAETVGKFSVHEEAERLRHLTEYMEEEIVCRKTGTGWQLEIELQQFRPEKFLRKWSLVEDRS